jgi:predicted restriction endonuclease
LLSSNGNNGMRKLRDDFQCKQCEKRFSSRYKTPKFCSQSCSAVYRNENWKPTKEQKRKTSKALRTWWKAHPEKQKEYGIASQKGKHKKPRTILELSTRTVSKICRRLNLACSRCGWDKETGDIHHIVPRKQGGTDDHRNLTYLCPNCHRLADRGKIGPQDLITLDNYIKDEWLKVYYG